MSYYGVFGGGGGTSDHRLLAGRSEASQHPAAAVTITAIGPLGADAATVQGALEALAERNGSREIRPVAAVALGIYKAVAFRVDGSVEPADHETPAHCSRLAGVALASASAGAEARICVEGPVRFNGWNWTPGAPVFVGRAGDLTQVPPESGFAQHMGFALGRDSLLVQIERSIRRA